MRNYHRFPLACHHCSLMSQMMMHPNGQASQATGLCKPSAESTTHGLRRSRTSFGVPGLAEGDPKFPTPPGRNPYTFRLPQAFNQVAELRKIVAAAARRLELGDLSSELDGAGRQDEQDASRASRSLVPARAHAPQRYGNRAVIPRSCSLGSSAAECVHCRKCELIVLQSRKESSRPLRPCLCSVKPGNTRTEVQRQLCLVIVYHRPPNRYAPSMAYIAMPGSPAHT